MAPRQPHEPVAMALQERVVPDQKARHLLPDEGCEGGAVRRVR
jgi:hypothetical protein